MLVGRGRNIVGAAQRLGEILRAFELAGGFGRTERLEPGRIEIVDDPRRDRRVRADHDKIHRVGPAEIDHRGVIGNVERDAFGLARDPGIAGRAPQFCDQRGSRDLPRQRVFAAAGPEQEDVHACRLANPRAGYKRIGALSYKTLLHPGGKTVVIPGRSPRGERTRNPSHALIWIPGSREDARPE